MLTRKRLIAAKVETTEGTGETLTNAEGGILAIDVKFNPDFHMGNRNDVLSTLSPSADYIGGQLARIQFKAEIKGPGAAYSGSVKPALSPYLRACGCAETIDTTPSSEKATYQPASSGWPSLTIGLYADGVIYRIIGARGNVKFSCEAGKPSYAEFDFLGVYDGTTDGAMLTPTIEATNPPVFLNAGFTIASYSAVINSINFDFGNTLAARDDVNKAAGYISTMLTGRRITGSMDPEMTLVAAHDWMGRWKAGTLGALNIGNIGSTQYNRWKITAPKLQYTGVDDSERNGLAVAGVKFLLPRNTGDDEFVLEFN